MSNEQSEMNNYQAVRPKVRMAIKRNEMKINHEAIETKFVKMHDLSGKLISVRLISKEFSLKISGIEYKEPTFLQFSTENSQLFQQMMLFDIKKLESLFTYLVSLPYFRFWSTIAYNKEVQKSLESYFIFASRSYRIHPVCKEKDIKFVLSSVHRLVFKICVRFLLDTETESNFMTESYHRELLTSTGNLVNAPNILNLLQIFGYGFGSDSICALLQPFVIINIDSFKNLIEEMMKILKNVVKTDLIDQSLGAISNFLNVVSNVTDILFSLNKLHFIETKISEIYKELNIVELLITFYSEYFPWVEKNLEGFSDLNYPAEAMCNCIKSQVSLSQSCILLIVYNQIQKVMLTSIFLPVVPGEDKDQPFDKIVKTLNQMTETKNFCFDYFTAFSFEDAFDSLLADDYLNVEFSAREILNYFKQLVEVNFAEIDKLRESSLKKNNRSNPLSLSFQYTPPKSNEVIYLRDPQNVSNDRQLRQVDEHDIRFDSEIIMKEKEVCELFPDLGDGYIYKCLEAYKFDIELTVDAILNKNLPPEVASLNTDIKKTDLVRARRDVLSNPYPSPSDWPVVDRFDPSSLKKEPPSDIFIGKKDKISNVFTESKKPNMKEIIIGLAAKINTQEEEGKENVKSLLERGKLDKEELKTNIDYIGMSDLYEDEFDDTYDNAENIDLTPGIDDMFVDNESGSSINKTENNGENSQSNTNRFKHSNFEKQDNASQYSKNKFQNKREYHKKQHQQQQVVPPQPPPTAPTPIRTNPKSGVNPSGNKGNNNAHSQSDRSGSKQHGGNNRNSFNGNNNNSNRTNQAKRNSNKSSDYSTRPNNTR